MILKWFQHALLTWKCKFAYLILINAKMANDLFAQLQGYFTDDGHSTDMQLE